MKKLKIIIIMFTVSLFITLPVKAASDHYVSYNYDYWKGIVPSAKGYRVKEVIFDADIGIDFTYIEDLFVTADYYYIVDSGGNKIVVLDKSFQLVHEITTYKDMIVNEDDEEIEADVNFKNPQGVFVTGDKIYITDMGNKKIVVLDKAYHTLDVFGKPNDPLLEKEFRPEKIVVDSAGRMYVVVPTENSGILELSREGEFSRFIGVQPVQTDVLDLIWRKFKTKEQLESSMKYLPVEYSNLAIDHEGFIYATATSNSSAPIQRLNPRGSDVLRDNGYYLPSGDISRFEDQDKSSLISIAVNDYGMYSVLDQTVGRIFTYNDEGYLTYVTGMKSGIKETEDTFINPKAIAYDGDNLIVIDSTDGGNNTITVFELTEFGSKVNLATQLTYNGDYMEASELWNDVVKYNSNYSLAYVGIGNSLYQSKDYKAAMEAFKLGQDRTGYSRAYERYRKEQSKKNFPYIATVISIVIAYALIKPMVSQYLKELREDELR